MVQVVELKGQGGKALLLSLTQIPMKQVNIPSLLRVVFEERGKCDQRAWNKLGGDNHKDGVGLHALKFSLQRPGPFEVSCGRRGTLDLGVKHPEIIGEHRILELVGQGASGVVYKARCPDSEETVALKLLVSTLDGTIVDKLRFEREFRLASTCDHPFLVKARAYGTSQGQPYYTMDLIEGVDFRNRFKMLREKDDKEAFSRVVDGLLDALRHIHDKGIVHRDLKPENVLVNAQDEPRILDFGLAKPQSGDDAASLTNPGTVLGTIHYLSPEQLSSRPLDGRSDLFSVGTMIYEVLSGHLPFDADHPIGVLGQILAQPPERFKLPEGYPPELLDVVLTLLAKEPSDRYQTVGEVLAEWRRLMFGVEEKVEARVVQVPEQLYMPRFVGQAPPLKAYQQLHEKDGPRVLLVAGEPGAGKSRFLEECVARAKARGARQNGARASEGESTPYELWIPALRQAFKRPEPEIMPLRTVLSPLLPELGFTRMGASSKAQLFEAMSRVLRLRGGLIWLDDAHLGDSASLEFLHYLARRLGPTDDLVVVATYTPSLAEKFVTRTRDGLVGAEFAKECTLEALSETEIRTMVGSMLGGELDEESAGLLYRESGGNPLYIGEVVKAALSDQQLSRESGKWRLGGASDRSIPQTMREQLSRQLESIEPRDVEVLKLAAVIGFDFDFELLSKTSKVQKMELLDRILRVSDKGFLIESDEVCFRFGSRALHQVLLESIPEEKRPALHLTVAQELEALEPRARFVVDIVRQYEASGELGKAVSHLLTAAAEASRNFAHKDALDFYERALEAPAELRTLPEALILEYRTDARHGLGQFREAQQEYEALLAKAQSTVGQVRLRRKIAECQQMLGNFKSAHEHLCKGLDLLGVGSSKKDAAPSKVAYPLHWVQKNFLKLSNKFNSDEVMSRQIHRILERQLSTLFFLRPRDWTNDLFELSSLQENVAKKLGNPEAVAQAQIFLGFVDLHRGKRDSALKQWEKGIEITSKLRETPYKALLLRNMGLMHLLAGKATRAAEIVQKTHQICQRLGDRPGLTQSHMVSCAVELHWANFDQALVHAREMLATADDAGLPVYRALGWAYLARATAHNDYLDEAQEHLSKAEELARQIGLPYVDMMVAMARSWVLCDLGQYPESLRAVEMGMDICDKVEALPFYRLTMRCAGLWGQSEWLKKGTAPAEVRQELPQQISEFKEETIHQGVEQFANIADIMMKRCR